MARRYLFGPVTPHYADQNLHEARLRGDCLAFNTEGTADVVVRANDTWQAVLDRLPAGWQPDFVVLYLPYNVIPAGLWSAPVPLVGLAADWTLQWHAYRYALPRCDLVLTDSLGVETLQREGITHARRASLFGCERAFLEEAADVDRDIDVLFVGNLDPAVQRARLTWLGRLAHAAAGRRVLIHVGAHGEDYRRLLRRARIVFNHSIRSEANRRTFEAAAAGALLFQEASNREISSFFRDHQECVLYDEDNLATLLHYYLDNEDERRDVANAARAKVAGFPFARQWDQIVEGLDASWPELTERMQKRVQAPPRSDLSGRTWQTLSAAVNGDPALTADLGAALASGPTAALHNALGLVLALQARQAQTPLSPATAAGYFQRAVAADPRHLLAGLNLAETLMQSGQNAAAAAQARKVLQLLRSADREAMQLEGGHYGTQYDLFHVEWERAAWSNAGQLRAETRAKQKLVTWRLHTLLGDLTGELPHFFDAAVCRPDLPSTRAALGCALARAGKLADAVPHLQFALESSPFDLAAARALFTALGQLDETTAQRRFARDRRLLSHVAPAAVPAETWFRDCPPPSEGKGDDLASLVILCCNQLDYSRQCLESVLQHTRPPYELLLIDNGSTDDTPAYLASLCHRAGPARVVVIRNDSNRGFAAGCNQGLKAARGRYLVLLNNDTLVTPGWLEGLINWSLYDWPHVGIVGPMTSCASPPQEVPVSYRTPAELLDFAAQRQQQFAGQAQTVERLIGFCMLFRREVWEQLGGLDEGFGLGFFEDDDLCVRARQAGLKLVMALNVFIHHYGNRTFQGLGVDAHAQLQVNFEKFRAKWGDERCKGYRLPPRGEPAPAPDFVATAAESTAPYRARVSLCMIVKNEERYLAACLASAADLVHEMIVVDTGSTDRTREIAAQAGARVVDFTWVDSFAAARNESLLHATGDWIFWLDADEVLDAANRGKLRNLLARLPDDNVAFVMRQLSKLEAGTHAAAQVDQVRLFRNRPDIRWQYRVHEQILLSVRRSGGAVSLTDIVIDHAGFSEAAVQGPKVDRNLRLLELEVAEHPDDAFVLYNLGTVHLTNGKSAEALDLFCRSISHCQSGDTLLRKLHALVVRAHHQLGHRAEALAACRQGQAVYPDDGELLFWEAILLHADKDLDGAAVCLQRILQARPPEHFTSVDAGLYGYRARHFLAEILRDQGRLAEAEAQWQKVVAERVDFPPAWRELAKIYFQQNRWPDLWNALPHFENDPALALEALLLRGRAHLARQEFPAAQAAFTAAATLVPTALPPRVFLSHVLLQEGKDWAAAERALQDVIGLDPDDREARHNLRVLHQQHGSQLNGVVHEYTSVPAKVSLCMIVRNEEHNLPACLEGIVDLVDDIVIVDTGSTDGTRAAAERFGARVYEFPWIDHFAAARNESLRHARGQWIFWLDADDRLDEPNRAKLRTLLAGLNDDNAAYVMKCLCLPDASGSATVVDHLRLFRNRPDVRWTFRVHEQILPSVRATGGEVRWSDVVIHHTGYVDGALRQRKLQRDLRLLELEEVEQPEHAFTLFNLGSVYQEMGRTAEALDKFQRSLERSAKDDSIVRKLYALIAQCQRTLGQGEAALATCRKGRDYFPDDVELSFQEGVALRGLGDRAGAIACWERCLKIEPGTHFASVHTGLNGYLTRSNLAGAYREEGRLDEAETQWRQALAERPGYEPAWRGMLDLFAQQQRWSDAETLARQMEDAPGLAAVCLRGRLHLARRDFATARQHLQTAAAMHPTALEVRVLLSHCLLQEGRDLAAAEQTLRSILTQEPDHAEAKHNLAVLLRQRGSA